jgi:hypothetical protein
MYKNWVRDPDLNRYQNDADTQCPPFQNKQKQAPCKPNVLFLQGLKSDNIMLKLIFEMYVYLRVESWDNGIEYRYFSYIVVELSKFKIVPSVILYFEITVKIAKLFFIRIMNTWYSDIQYSFSVIVIVSLL